MTEYFPGDDRNEAAKDSAASEENLGTGKRRLTGRRSDARDDTQGKGAAIIYGDAGGSLPG